MQKNMEKMFFILEIIAFQCAPVSYVYNEGDSWDPQSTCYQRFLKSQIWLEAMFLNWILFRINVKLG